MKSLMRTVRQLRALPLKENIRTGWGPCWAHCRPVPTAKTSTIANKTNVVADPFWQWTNLSVSGIRVTIIAATVCSFFSPPPGTLEQNPMALQKRTETSKAGGGNKKQHYYARTTIQWTTTTMRKAIKELSRSATNLHIKGVRDSVFFVVCSLLSSAVAAACVPEVGPRARLGDFR